MKKVTKETFLRLSNVSSEVSGCMITGGSQRFYYTFESNKYYNEMDLRVVIEVDEAETIKEFREINGLEKSDIVDFLNQNYDK
jgi:hypothetical protein